MPEVRSLWNLLAILLAATLLWVGPFAVADRSFSGSAVLGNTNEQIPDVTFLFNFSLTISILILSTAIIPQLPNKTRPWTYGALGGLILLGYAGATWAFYQEVWTINQAALYKRQKNS